MSYDVIIIGAGHNGLTTAAFLARAGRKVLVLEQREEPGGLAASEEFHPGYRTAGVLHDTSAVRPRVVEALELESHGLRRRTEPIPVFAPEADGPGLLLFRDPERARAELAARSAVDADRYAAFRDFLQRMGGYVARVLNEPPPDVTATGLRSEWPLLASAWALRRLGHRAMLELLRVAPMCAADWLQEWFEDELLMALLAAPAVSGTWMGPRSAGTAALLLMHECGHVPEIDGGPPALVRALRAACDDRGVELRTRAAVRRITVSAGRVTGVELDTGEVVAAPRVASSLDPRRTFLELIAPPDLPPGLGEAMRSWRCRGTTAKLHLALDGPLELDGRPDQRFEAIRVGKSLVALEQAFDAVKYREMSARPLLDVRVPTVADPSLAPEGHHVVSILVHFAPHDLRGGWNEAARSRLLHSSIEHLARFAPALRDRIVAHELLTPADLEERYGLSGGHPHHGEHALDQLFWLRPDACCARYSTPLGGLYLCGSGSHPGGGITGGPGALASDQILRS